MQTKLINLNHGAKLLVCPNHTVNGIYVGLYFNAGSFNDPKGKEGLAHFCEHALGRFPTNRYDRDGRQKIVAKFQNKNAWTRRDQICLHVSATKENIAEAVEYLSYPITNLIYDKAYFNTEKRVIEAEISGMRNFNTNIEQAAIFSKIIKDKRLRNQTTRIAGTIESLNRITLSDIKNYIEKYFTLDNLTIIMSGNISTGFAKKIYKTNIEPFIPKTSGTLGFDGDTLEPGFNKPKSYYFPSVEKTGATVFFISPIKTLGANDNTLDKVLEREILSDLVGLRTHKFFRNELSLCYSGYSLIQETADIEFCRTGINCTEENIENVLNAYVSFRKMQHVDEDIFNSTLRKKIVNLNFDTMSIQSTAETCLLEYLGYNNLLGDKLNKRKKKALQKITYRQISERYKNLFTQLPHIVIISNNEKWKDFDYKAYYKKLNKK